MTLFASFEAGEIVALLRVPKGEGVSRNIQRARSKLDPPIGWEPGPIALQRIPEAQDGFTPSKPIRPRGGTVNVPSKLTTAFGVPGFPEYDEETIGLDGVVDHNGDGATIFLLSTVGDVELILTIELTESDFQC